MVPSRGGREAPLRESPILDEGHREKRKGERNAGARQQEEKAGGAGETFTACDCEVSNDKREGVPGNPNFDMRGGLWLQKNNMDQDRLPLWKGEIQIDGNVYLLEGRRPYTDNAKAPEVALTARLKEAH